MNKYVLSFRVQAGRDLEDIQEYYLKISERLSARFFSEFFSVLQYIEQEPQLFQERYRGIRIAPLHKFPYGIHYKEDKDKIIVYRVLHTKRYFK